VAKSSTTGSYFHSAYATSNAAQSGLCLDQSVLGPLSGRLWRQIRRPTDKITNVDGAPPTRLSSSPSTAWKKRKPELVADPNVREVGVCGFGIGTHQAPCLVGAPIIPKSNGAAQRYDTSGKLKCYGAGRPFPPSATVNSGSASGATAIPEEPCRCLRSSR
jgi:hypothetical protein